MNIRQVKHQSWVYGPANSSHAQILQLVNMVQKFHRLSDLTSFDDFVDVVREHYEDWQEQQNLLAKQQEQEPKNV